MSNKLSRKELLEIAEDYNIPRIRYMNMIEICEKLQQFGVNIDCKYKIKSPKRIHSSKNTKKPQIKEEKLKENDNNDKLIVELKKLVKQKKYEISKEKDTKIKKQLEIRLSKINNLIKIINEYPYKIIEGKQISHIEGVGIKSVQKVDEILSKGYLSDVIMNDDDIKNQKYIENLKKVFGIGDDLATKLVDKGIKNITQLKKAYKNGEIKLNHKVELGLKYYSNKINKIPRSEIDEINELFNDIIPTIDKNLNYIICGSYRRGKSESNDIDILLYNTKIITNEDINRNKNFLKLLIKKLKEINFIIDDILPNYNILYEGYCKLDNNPVRRIDIKYIPMMNFYPALLQFTGPANFNANLSLIAIKEGYKLSGNGLYKIEKNDYEKFIPISSEEEIFKILGIKYIKPKDRDNIF